jgi:uncharacterized protein YabN with tetrapyrrole methylase and pyrophosphatase domain
MAQIQYSDKELKRQRKERAKAMLKSAPKWMQMLVKEMNLEPETVKISLDTPIATLPGHPHVGEHTGQVLISIEGWRKVKRVRSKGQKS